MDLILPHIGTFAAITAAGWLLNLTFLPSVINARKPAVSALSWVLALWFLPWLGALLYMTIGETRLRRRVRHRRQAAFRMTRGTGRQPSAARCARPDGLSGLAGSLATLAESMDAPHAVTGNRADLLVDGKATFDGLFEAIRGAEHDVNVLYYIYETDETGEALREVLIERAKAGVTVRLLLDAVGSWKAGLGFFDALEAAGGSVTMFAPARWTGRRLELNFRNHRKIAVIDGKIGFTGGLNVGNVYSGMGVGTKAWHDIHLRLTGPAVAQLQAVFASDWFFATDEHIDSPPLETETMREDSSPGDCGSLVQIVSSGPDHEWSTLHQLFFAAITQATNRVRIMTPYFVPTESLVTALTTAAQRGVEVSIVIPETTDTFIVDFATRSYYPELLKAGVRIYECGDRMIHAKVLTFDSQVASVGTCNLDTRSFDVNFEVQAFVYAEDFTEELDAVIEADMESSNEVLLSAFAGRRFRARLAQNAARLLSPLL